ncbi:DNA polymerase IV [Dorea sp. YH-dor226]|uniref:Y-family DNA polymerase n=1 Tax=Dorea sp. YH-dor226 TaxID=3151119 RepID=UPI003241BB84
MSIIFHIDVNSAYLSWTAVEQLKHGAEVDIRTIPAIIGGDQKSRHGVVLAKSIPAKKYGIHTGEPVVNAFRKCPNLRMEPPDHKLYHQYSEKLMDFLRSYTDRIEQVSVDECYMDFTGIAGRFHSPVEGALEIKNEVYRRFGFTVNIGISCNKLLAKMASDFEKPNKVHTLFPEEIPEKMWPLPIGELYMAGRSSVETLQKLEILTIGDLAHTDPVILELHLKSHGRKLWEFANGIDHSMVETEKAEAKGIGNSTTLPKDVVTEEEAKAVLKELAASVGGRLRKAGQKAGMLSVEIKYHTFDSVSHQKQIERPTNQDADIYEISVVLFRELWNREPIRLLGIRSSKLSEEGEPEQLSLFDMEFEPEEKRKKKRQLNAALEKIRGKYGTDIVTKGPGKSPLDK